jgi:Peptidase M50B-like
MSHLHRTILIGSFLPLSWLGMQAVHECGHVLGAWLTGGAVAKVVLHPLTISYTQYSANPHPLVTVWAGPLGGILIPLALWGCAAGFRFPGAYLFRFFAGFCLVANGAYIALGSFARIGDAGVMLDKGAAAWQLWLFGVLAVPLGLWLWHGQGKYFGVGKNAEKTHPTAAYGVFVLLAFTLAAELILAKKR